jgi:hypothetical protein
MALKTLFASMASSVHDNLPVYGPVNMTGPRSLTQDLAVRQDWCLLLADLITVPHPENPLLAVSATSQPVPFTTPMPSSSSTSPMRSAPVPTATSSPSSVTGHSVAARPSSRVAGKSAATLLSDTLTPTSNAPAPAAVDQTAISATPVPAILPTPSRASIVSIVPASLVSATWDALQRSKGFKLPTLNTPEAQSLEVLMQNVQRDFSMEHALTVATAIRGCFKEV